MNYPPDYWEKSPCISMGLLLAAQHSQTYAFLMIFIRILGNRQQVDAIYTDFSKAFDRFSHKRLISKLWNFGIRGNLLSLISSYLADRSQAVRINNCISARINVSSGVPQDSHLGPLLFCIYINDLHSQIKNSNILIYADDVKIYRAVGSPDDTMLLHEDLLSLSNWSILNGLSLNVAKCSVISFSRKRNGLSREYSVNGINLERVGLVKDLGVLFYSALTFSPHVEYIVSKSLRTLGFVKRSTAEFRDVTTISYLCKTLISPMITYCAQIWSPFTDTLMKKLESVQHKCLRYLTYKANWPMSRLEHNYSETAENFNL